MKEAVPLTDLSTERQRTVLKKELENIKGIDSHLKELVKEKSAQLIEAHEQ